MRVYPRDLAHADTIEKLAQHLALDIPFQPSMLDPFATDRILGGGDPDFATRNTIDKDLAWRWRKTILEPRLHPDTLEIAKRLGY